MRRLAPRPLRHALDGVARQASPPGTLAAVQAVWAEVVGPATAAAALPVAERDGVVTVRCESAVWAQELELLGGDLTARLSERLGSGGGLRELRFTVAGGPRRGRP